MTVQQRVSGAGETTPGTPQPSAREKRARWQVRAGGSRIVEREVRGGSDDACSTRNWCGGREIHVTHIRQQ